MKKMIMLSLYALAVWTSCSQPMEKAMQSFIDAHVQTVAPLMKEANLAYWKAATTGEEIYYDEYAKLDYDLKKIYTNTTEYAQLKQWAEKPASDPMIKRQIDLLRLEYLPNQIDSSLLKEIVELSSSIEQQFSTFRGTINGKPVTSNEIEEILKSATYSGDREKAWEASKQIGPEIADQLVHLVKLRNQAARSLGFDNYHTLYLYSLEQDVNEITRIFDELEQLTRQPFIEMKSEVDALLAKSCGIALDEMMPWHYHDPFFQESPSIYSIDLDHYYADKDVKVLAQTYYTGIGLDVQSILDNSDLYERDGKNPHAFCTDIDREGDVRVLCNLKNTERWMETMLHELGHAVYDKYESPETPFLLRQPAHIFTTEAIAMFFGRLSRDADWMQQMLNLSDEETEEIREITVKYARMKQLIFARWAMVMFSFEKELYNNPDQDLNKLWWDTVEKYQMIKRPEGRDMPDWAAKIHFTIAPCYYHNYLLGELFASQIHHQLLSQGQSEKIEWVNNMDVGHFMKEKIFLPGATKYWNTMIEEATGEPLNPKYFVDQFVAL